MAALYFHKLTFLGSHALMKTHQGISQCSGNSLAAQEIEASQPLLSISFQPLWPYTPILNWLIRLKGSDPIFPFELVHQGKWDAEARLELYKPLQLCLLTQYSY